MVALEAVNNVSSYASVEGAIIRGTWLGKPMVLSSVKGFVDNGAEHPAGS